MDVDPYLMEVFSLEHSVLKYEPWIQLLLIWSKKKKKKLANLFHIQTQNALLIIIYQWMSQPYG